MAHRVSRGLFTDSIKKVLSQTHPVLSISNDAIHFLDIQLFQLLKKICSSTFTTIEGGRAFINSLFPEEIAIWALKDTVQMIAIYEMTSRGPSTLKRSISSIEGLIFPIEILLNDTYFLSEKKDPDVCVFILSVVEYICADILKMAGNYAENHRRKTIDLSDIRATLRLDPLLQELFGNVRSDFLLANLCKLQEKFGRSKSYVTKIIAESVKNVKDHVLFDIFQMFLKFQEFHNGALKIFSEASGFQGIVQTLEHLNSYKQFFIDYSKEFDKVSGEIEKWIESPNIQKILEDREITRAAELHLRKLLWLPLHLCACYLGCLTELVHLLPLDPTLLQLAKDFGGMSSDLAELGKKFEYEIESEQDCRSSYWKYLECIELQNKMEGWEGKNLVDYDSKLVKEGTIGIISVSLGSRKDKKPKERIFWLFDKFLIMAKPADYLLTKKNFFYELRDIIHLNGLSIRETVPDLEDSKYSFEIIKDDQNSIIVTAKNEKEKNEWLSSLYREISLLQLAYNLERVLMLEAFQGPELPPSLRLTVEEYQFAVPDCPDNILFEINEGGGIPLIKGATVLKLVERLTFDKYADTNYLLQFLLTYRSFMEPMELLSLLIERFNYPTPKNASDEELEYFKQSIRRPVQLRVFNVAKNWVDKHYLDFQESKELLKKFLEFIKDDMTNVEDMDKAAASLTKAIRKKRDEETEEANKVFVPGPNDPVIVPIRTGISAGFINLLDLDPLEVARQLTLIEYKLYKEIPSYECLNQRWTRKNKEKEAPHILAMIDRFNQVSNWVKTYIVYKKDYQPRVDLIEYFIKVAEKCMEINNYNAMTEIISGLNSIPVNRLRLTWGGVNKKSLQSFQEMSELMAHEKSYAKFRKHLHTRNPPCLPYFGVYLTDLTFIEEGNKDIIPGTDLINFNKRRKTAAVIAEIQQYQQTRYPFQEVHEIIDFLLDFHIEEDEHCYQKSLEIEPRQLYRTMSENLNGDKQPFPEINKVNHEPQIPSFRDGRKGSVVLQTMFRSVSNATTNAFNKISGNDQQENRKLSHSKSKILEES